MNIIWGRLNKIIKPRFVNVTKSINYVNWRKKYKLLGAIGIAAVGGIGTIMFALDQVVDASELAVHPPHQPWSHNGVLSSLDHNSLRRGYEVYKNVCSSCHSCQYIAYRNLVNNTHTEAEAKAEAEAITVRDGPNDEGEYFERPGKLSDYFPSPYPNEESARVANNGAYPPDLSYIVAARKGGENYIFALLTGYMEAPAGVVLRDGMYFNPYFAGGAISMGQVISDGALDYSDGTPPSASQIAKDIATFLKWTSEPEHDERKLMLLRVVIIMSFLTGVFYYVYKFKWSILKSRKMYYLKEKRHQEEK